MDLGSAGYVSYVRIVPRSDDNDVCPDNEYELFYYDGNNWNSLGFRYAQGNSLHYDNVPLNTLLWLRNYTRGRDERPFIVDDEGNLEWW